MTPEGWLYILVGGWLCWRLVVWVDREVAVMPDAALGSCIECERFVVPGQEYRLTNGVGFGVCRECWESEGLPWR